MTGKPTEQPFMSNVLRFLGPIRRAANVGRSPAVAGEAGRPQYLAWPFSSPARQFRDHRHQAYPLFPSAGGVNSERVTPPRQAWKLPTPGGKTSGGWSILTVISADAAGPKTQRHRSVTSPVLLSTFRLCRSRSPPANVDPVRRATTATGEPAHVGDDRDRAYANRTNGLCLCLGFLLLI